MFGSLQRSWELGKETWNVLRQDRALVVFPILAGIASLLVSASFLIPAVLWFTSHEVGRGAGGRAQLDFGPLQYALTFLYYLVSYFVVVFFNTGLVACVRMRFSGQSPTVSDGFQFAVRNLGLIFKWSLLSATVGTIIRVVEERADWLGRIIIGLVGVAWSIATTFAVPVLVYDQVGPIEAVKRSAQAFRRTWGATVVANFGLNTAFWLLFLPSLVLLVSAGIIAGGMAQANGALAGLIFGGALLLCVLYWLALAIIQSTLQGIFLTACYHYASTGVVPSAFTPEHVINAWRPKSAK
jgi:hypothetical protein